MSFKIEKGVKMKLNRYANVGRKAIYPFLDMKVGDSFKFDPADVNKVRSAALAHGRRYASRFTTSGTEARCWRVK